MLRHLILLLLLPALLPAQNLKLTLLDVKALGKEGRKTLYQARIKVVSGTVGPDSPTQLALPLPDGRKGFVRLDAWGDQINTGQESRTAYALDAVGCELKSGQTLVSHDLAVVAKPKTPSFKLTTATVFIDSDPKVFFGSFKTVEGSLHVGDELTYTNSRGQTGRGKIIELDVENRLMPTDVAMSGFPEHVFGFKLQAETTVDFSDAVAVPAGSAPVAATTTPAAKPVPAPASKASIKSIPVNAVLENSDVRITVHNLVKYNPVKGEGIDIFKIDYSLDYYIVDATIENKTKKPLDCGDYLLRFNFFTPDGQSADEFTRLFKAGQSTDGAKKDAEKVDLNIFGGTGKIVMANVLVKYQETIPDYLTKHKPNTDALNKPLAPGQKVHSIDATIMGVPPEYKIQGVGTWTGTFYDKKKLIYTPVKVN